MVAIWLDATRPMPSGFDLHFEDGETMINWLDNLKTIIISKISFDHDWGSGYRIYLGAFHTNNSVMQHLNDSQLVNLIKV